MTQDQLLMQLLQRLDEPAARYGELDRYYQGRQPLAFLSPEAKTALGNRFGLMASNIPRLAVTALAQRRGRPTYSDVTIMSANDLFNPSTNGFRSSISEQP